MLYDKVYNTIKQHSLIADKKVVIAAVSGGADSVCLLDVLTVLAEKLDITVVCAHLNHNLRGAESDGDEQYVKELCEKYNIKLYTRSVDIKALSSGKSIEEVARDIRYAFFDELCQKENALVATAHTVNDNTETFFINVLRSSGSRGLYGIPIKRGNIIRPLLNASREEIIKHLDEVGLSFRTDSSNSDTDYLRNFIRHEIIPVFEKRQGINIFKSVNKVTENLYKENLALCNVANECMTDDIEKLRTLDDAILYRVLTAKLEKSFDIILDSVHFEAVKKLLTCGGTKVQIKGDIYAICEKGKFSFQKTEQKKDFVYQLKTGENIVENSKILIKNVKEIYKALTKSYADCDKINGNLFLRTRKDGDTFKPIGRNGTSKLSKLLKNDGVPKKVRDSMFVICDEDENIVFAEGYGVSADFAAGSYSKNIISIEIISIYGGQ